jgi:hypothetical protein
MLTRPPYASSQAEISIRFLLFLFNSYVLGKRAAKQWTVVVIARGVQGRLAYLGIVCLAAVRRPLAVIAEDGDGAEDAAKHAARAADVGALAVTVVVVTVGARGDVGGGDGGGGHGDGQDRDDAGELHFGGCGKLCFKKRLGRCFGFIEVVLVI